jgi:hypothetical protein
MTDKRGSIREVALSPSATVTASALYVVGDNNSVIVAPANETVAALLLSIGATTLARSLASVVASK